MTDLRTAAQAVVDRWDTPLWKDAPHTGDCIQTLRVALAQHTTAARDIPKIGCINHDCDMCQARPPPDHKLFTDADKDRPDSICDSNGSVTLSLCKVCGRGEADLEARCKPQQPAKRAVTNRCPKCVWLSCLCDGSCIKPAQKPADEIVALRKEIANAKSLIVDIYALLPEQSKAARQAIDKRAGCWFVWGVDRSADANIAQPVQPDQKPLLDHLKKGTYPADWLEFGEALKAAQPEQEPVGHLYTIAGVQHCTIEKVLPDGPLFTSPPQRQPMTILMITTAYEQGVGKGHQATQRNGEIENPYAPGECREAWQLGYKEGKTQVKYSHDTKPNLGEKHS